ncbi:hypothetical protein FAM09_13695 [Niastella caeni]|uniref:Porin n=1 Tax=Niastella caeni TaxID=2569763 RepID=A0A4S8I1I5_9BACT|nr:hypothetical protein [Niastella caeni]THU39552.1 hypothetical protein FAM09_13695 [Niastella caeni]
MKSLLHQAIKILLLSLVLIPLASQAQVEKISYMRPSYFRPYDQTGINKFETSKEADQVPFDGLRVRLGAGFTQQFQNLKHENTTADNSEGANKIYPIKPGFMTAQANLFLDVQLADGIRLNLTTYLSSRHHNETWVKGGYIQFDKLPFKGKFWDDLMKMATIKIGHMEINYGDAHFRRSDGGHTLYNPFMESYIMDAFATEIGGEIYLQKNGFFGMAGMTNGMIKGHIDSVAKTTQDDNTKRAPSLYGKVGFDKQITEILRVRVSGSYYHNSSSAGSGLTLYSGDRTGSNYQNVMELWKDNAGAVKASTAMYASGRLNPGFSKKLDAVMLNSFVKLAGFELFGTYETAQGRTKNETNVRKASQYAIDGLYRFGKAEKVFLGVRYNSANATLAGQTNDITINRFAIAGGWFIVKNVLLKAEWVDQRYKDFTITDYRSGGKFNGYVIEAVVGF